MFARVWWNPVHYFPTTFFQSLCINEYQKDCNWNRLGTNELFLLPYSRCIVSAIESDLIFIWKKSKFIRLDYPFISDVRRNDENVIFVIEEPTGTLFLFSIDDRILERIVLGTACASTDPYIFINIWAVSNV